MRLKEWRERFHKKKTLGDIAWRFGKFAGHTSSRCNQLRKWRAWEERPYGTYIPGVSGTTPCLRDVYLVQQFTKGLVLLEDWLTDEEKAH